MITTNTLALSNYDKAADKILALIDDLGFTTDRAFDSDKLRREIVWSIVSASSEEQEPTDEDLDEMLAEIKEEAKQAQGNFYNTCPHCGQLVR